MFCLGLYDRTFIPWKLNTRKLGKSHGDIFIYITDQKLTTPTVSYYGFVWRLIKPQPTQFGLRFTSVFSRYFPAVPSLSRRFPANPGPFSRLFFRSLVPTALMADTIWPSPAIVISSRFDDDDKRARKIIMLSGGLMNRNVANLDNILIYGREMNKLNYMGNMVEEIPKLTYLI